MPSEKLSWNSTVLSQTVASIHGLVGSSDIKMTDWNKTGFAARIVVREILRKVTLKWAQFPRMPPDSEYAAARSCSWRPLSTHPQPHLAPLLVVERHGHLSRPDFAGVWCSHLRSHPHLSIGMHLEAAAESLEW